MMKWIKRILLARRNNVTLDHFYGKIRSLYPYILLPLSIFFIFYIFNSSNPISSDSIVHAAVVRYISENHSIPSYIPGWIVDISNGRTYFPLLYPIFAYLTMVPFYTMFREVGLFVYSSVVAAAFALVICLFTSGFSSKKVGLLTGSLIFISPYIFETFARTILLDQMLVLLYFVALFFYVKLLKVNKRRYAIYTGIAAGLALGTKQTGSLFVAALLFHTVLYGIYEICAKKSITVGRLKMFLLLYGTMILTGAPLLLYFIKYAGTIDYPGATYFWFLKPKWKLDPVSVSYLAKAGVTFGVSSTTLQGKAWYVLRSMFYTFAGSAFAVPFRCLIFLFFGLGIWYLLKKNRLILSVFGVSIVVDASFLVRLENAARYYVLSQSLIMITIALGIYMFYELVGRAVSVTKPPSQGTKKRLAIFYVITVCLFSIATPMHFYELYHANYHHIVEPLHIDRSRSWMLAAKWARENTPKDSIFLANRDLELAYPSRRDAAWITMFGMNKLPDVLLCRDLRQTMDYLENYGIDYIVYDPYYVLGDYYPGGVTSFLNYGDPHFQLVYEDDNNPPFLKIYKIIYDKNIPIYDTYLAENGSVELLVGEGLDGGVFYPNVRAVFVDPADRWILTSKGLMALETYNYINVMLSPSVDKDNDGFIDKPIFISIKGNVPSLSWFERSESGLIVHDAEITADFGNIKQFEIERAWYNKVDFEYRWGDGREPSVHPFMILMAPKGLIEAMTISFSRNISPKLYKEEYNPIVITDCENITGWSVQAGPGSVNLDSSDYVKGSASIRGDCTAQGKFVVRYDIGSEQNCSGKGFLCLYAKVNDVRSESYVSIRDTNGNERWWFVKWGTFWNTGPPPTGRYVLSLNGYSSQHEGFDILKVRYIEICMGIPCVSGDSIWIDRILFDTTEEYTCRG